MSYAAVYGLWASLRTDYYVCLIMISERNVGFNTMSLS